MADPFIGEIKLCGFDFPPRGWALCQGSTLSIAQNTALFALLGTSFGGNGTVTFGLPDLQGRMPIGSSPQTSIGEQGGTESEIILTQNMPAHAHGTDISDSPPTEVHPQNMYPAQSAGTVGMAYGPAANSQLSADSLVMVGQGQPHSNLQPYLTMNYVIALQGIFPARP